MTSVFFRRRAMRRLAIAGLAGLLPGLSASGAAAADPLQLSDSQLGKLGVRLGEPRPADAASLVGLPARVVVPPQQTHLVSAPLAGVVSQLAVGPGQPVRRGDVLLRLASPTLAEIRRGIAQAASQQQLAERAMRRDQQLFDEGLIAESRYRATQAALAESRAALTERRQALQLSGAGERGGADGETGLVLRSPIDGIVLELSTLPSARVEPAAPLLKLARTDVLWLEIELPLRDAARVGGGGTAQVRSGAAGDQPLVARLIGMAADIAGNSQTLTLRAQVDGAGQRLRPGQFVSVDLSLPGQGEALWRVPTVAIARIGERPTIFVLVDGTLRPLAVEVRQASADEAVIAAPLATGSRIALSGAASLKAIAVGIGAGGGE